MLHCEANRQKKKEGKIKIESSNGTIQITFQRGVSVVEAAEVEAEHSAFSGPCGIASAVPLRSSHEVARCVVTKNNETKVP
jgi:hypothetical protein